MPIKNKKITKEQGEKTLLNQPVLSLSVIFHWLITFFSFAFFKRMKGGNEIQLSDQELSGPACIQWSSTMQIQLLISLLQKQLISGPLSSNDVLTNT